MIAGPYLETLWMIVRHPVMSWRIHQMLSTALGRRSDRGT